MSFDGEIFDPEIFDVALEPKHWGYVLPFKLQRRFFAIGRISRLESVVLDGKCLITKSIKQSVHGTGKTDVTVKADIRVNLSHLKRKEKHLALGSALAFTKVVWHAEAKTVKGQRSVWAIQARTLRSQHLAAKTVGKKSFGLVLEALELLELDEEQRFYLYIAIMDDRTCPQCLKYDGYIMTRREVGAIFKFLVKLDDNIWFPTVHPNCRCMLILWEIEL